MIDLMTANSLVLDSIDKCYSKDSGTASNRIRLEVGDAKDLTQFYPQFKTLHWDNECNFSVRLIDLDYTRATVVQKPGFIEWTSPERVVRFYETPINDKQENGGFEFEVEYASAPTSNIIQFSTASKGLNFFYQSPLTPEEIKRGVIRPDNVVGSYAVYNASQKHNFIGGKNYSTGKAFHLYRPFAVDKNQTKVWCDLNIDEKNSLLTITVPQDFIDNAVYPIIIDPTYGYTSLGASFDGTNNSAVAYNVGSFGGVNNSTIASATWYGNVSAGPASKTVEVGIYSNGAGIPVNLLGKVSAIIALTTTPTQFAIAQTNSFQLQNGTTYWLGSASDFGNNWQNAFDSGGIDDSFTGSDITLPNPWLEAGSSGSRQYSFFLNLTSGGGSPAILGKTIQSQYSEGEDRSFFSTSKLTKPQAGGAAPPGASKLGKVFQSQFNDILGYDFVSSSKQTKGQPGGAAPPGASILGKSFVNNPAPNPETEWDYANGVFVGSASPGVASTPNVPNLVPKVVYNVLFVDYLDFSQYQSKIIRGQPGVPPIIGLPRHSYINVAATAAQIVDDDSMFISRFGVKASHPAKGIIPAPPVTNVISGAGLVGAGTMRGN